MKKRYIGVVHITPEGDGKIEIISETMPSLQKIKTLEKAPSIGGLF